MTTILVDITRTAEVEVDVEFARTRLRTAYGFEQGEVDSMTDDEVVEIYVGYAEGIEFDLAFDQTVTAVAPVEEAG